MRIAIIQLARTGDIVSILPVAKMLADQGHQVTFVTCPEFCDIFEAVSYVEVLYHPGPRDVTGAAEKARQLGFDRVICAQVDGNPDRPPVESANFIIQQWGRTGYADRFHDLPLIFDRRDREAEQQAIEKHVPKDDGRPLLAYNLNGHSSPYRHRPEQGEWIKRTFKESHRLLDLSNVRLPKSHHLLGLLEAADVLLTIDTLTLHLAYATMTPTVAMSVGKTPWDEKSDFYNSEPRFHWLYRCTYEQSIWGEVRGEIERIIRGDYKLGTMCRSLPVCRFDRIWHVMDWYLVNEEDTKRIRKAQRTWEHLLTTDRNYRVVLHDIKPDQRNSRSELGDTRTLPYIRDIIDRGAEKAHDDDILIFTNSDVSIVPEALDEIRGKLAKQPCCYSRRVEVTDAGKLLSLADLRTEEAHVGADLFAFRAGWWRKHRLEFPDLLLAAEGWDFVARRVLEKHNPDSDMRPCVIYHQRHQSWWARPENVHENPGQVWNRQLCLEFAKKNDLGIALFGGDSCFLFKPDWRWKQELAKRVG